MKKIHFKVCLNKMRKFESVSCQSSKMKDQRERKLFHLIHLYILGRIKL
jgi:hypothetical protein